MAGGDIIIPPYDLTSAAIEAVNLILTELHISPLDILLSLFTGKPKFADTDAVIAAYQQSAYWPLHVLASDLQIAANNGAPISDSNPAIQAQFGAWKQGTVTSIQTFAGGQAGATDPGYWTIFALIEDSWKASGDGEGAVLQYVKALDALTQVLSVQNGQTTLPPVVPAAPPGPAAPPCPPFQALPDCLPGAPGLDHALDEMGNGFAGVAYWLQVIAIYLMNIFQRGAGTGSVSGGNPDPVTCTQLTGLFDRLIAAIVDLNVNTPPSAPPDLTPLVNAITGQIPPATASLPPLPALPALVPYTAAAAEADIQASILLLPNLAAVSQT
jgi:hypothetical protein